MFKLALLSITAIAAIIGMNGSLKDASAKTLPRDTKVIVELKHDVNQFDAINSIRGLVNDNFQVKDRFSHIANAIVLDINSSYVDSLRELDFVNSVTVDTFHVIKTHESDYAKPLGDSGDAAHLESDNSSSETMHKPEGTKEGEGIAIAILDTGANLNHVTFTDLDASVSVKYTQEGIQDLIKGTSFHGKPDATHTTYWNRKVPFYYDYGGQVTSEDQDPKEDYDVLDTVEDHGNHVASLAAGNDPAYKGIAPNAQILVMKVFTDSIATAPGETSSTGAYDFVILKALEDCAILGVDMINMSLGSDLTDFTHDRYDTLTYKAIASLKKNGVSINISNGNAGKGMYSKSGPIANWTTDMVETGILGSYATFEDSTSIASGVQTFKFYETALMVGSSVIDYSDQITDYQTADGEVVYKPNRYLTDITKGGTITNFEWIRIPGWGEASDYTDRDVTGKVVVVDRGETSFLSKITNAENKGAIAVIIINNDPTETSFTFRMDLSGNTPGVPVVSILYRDRELFTTAKAGDPSVEPETGALKIVSNEFADCPDSYTVSTFSSDGANVNYDLKPEITSPGDEIKGATYLPAKEDGTYPNDQYSYYGGTSMAAPNYCGAEAVILSEHLGDAEYKRLVEARIMSTADQLLYEKGTADKSFASPRMQGAGMVNIEKALQTNVVLEGFNAKGEPSGKAKVNLFNNADIASGKISLSFLAHNYGEATSYTATVYVMRPALVTLNEENYPEYKGVKFQSTRDTVIMEESFPVNVASGTSTITIPTISLTDAEKAEIDASFENGCPIEGYVVLKAEGKTTISLPYLGFYGDYTSGAPVEPFDFEREAGKVYPSDITNRFISDMGFPNGNISSQMAVGYVAKGEWESFSIEQVLLNETNLYRMRGFRPLGADPDTGKVDPNNLYLGNNGVSNMLIIQQFVTRSVDNNRITLTNLDTGKVVLRDHMFDDLFGFVGEEDDPAAIYPLAKSHICVDFVAAGIFAHRAYTLIPTYDLKTGVDYPDGTYEMKMEYDLTAGGTYTKTYTLHIDSKAPEYKKVTKNEDGSLRVRFNESKLSYTSVNGNRVAFKTDSEGYYIDVTPKADDTRVIVSACDYAGAISKMLIDVKTDYNFTIIHPSMANNVNITLNITESTDKKNVVFDVSLTQKNKELVLGPASYAITVGDNWESVKVYVVKNGVETEVTGSYLADGVVHFDAEGTSFKIVLINSEPTPTPSNVNWGLIGGCIGGGVAVAAGIGIAIYFFLKKKKAA